MANSPTHVNELTWEGLIELEPQLKNLRTVIEAAANYYKDEEFFCANDYWIGAGMWEGRGKKAALCLLVGWDRINTQHYGVLGTPEAYDLAYQTLYDLLPDCTSNCGCL